MSMTSPQVIAVQQKRYLRTKRGELLIADPKTQAHHTDQHNLSYRLLATANTHSQINSQIVGSQRVQVVRTVDVVCPWPVGNVFFVHFTQVIHVARGAAR